MTTAAQLSENSHQGFDGIKATLCLGSMEVKSNTASGMPLCLWPNGIGSRSSGKERDAETGLDYFLARYYSGAQGRFLSVDPGNAGAFNEDPQSWNAYAYGRNNPLVYTDPDGLSYTLCLPGGGCMSGYSDIDFAKNFKWGIGISLQPDGFGGGTIYDSGVYIGSYQYEGFFFDEVERRLGYQADATKQLIGNLIADSAVSGVVGFAIGKAIDAGVKAYETYQASKSLANIGGMIRTAAGGKGNFGIGAATRQEAQAMGEAWVGPGARVASDGKTLVSADGLRVYRPPSFKPNLGKVQANFETKVVPGGRPVSNGHLDIK